LIFFKPSIKFGRLLFGLLRCKMAYVLIRKRPSFFFSKIGLAKSSFSQESNICVGSQSGGYPGEACAVKTMSKSKIDFIPKFYQGTTKFSSPGRGSASLVYVAPNFSNISENVRATIKGLARSPAERTLEIPSIGGFPTTCALKLWINLDFGFSTKDGAPGVKNISRGGRR